MARKPRIHLPGGVYHVMLRGNDGCVIFKSNEDRLIFESLLEEGVNRYEHRIHAYCWMTNHVHLAIQVKETPLSKIIQNLSFRYTRYVNKKYKRIGHLFQGRYKAILIDSDAYLKELVRYIHLNPVRANLVKLPDDYQWSGHGCYTGQTIKPWLVRNWVLSMFAKNTKIAIERYSSFVMSGMTEGYREDFNYGCNNGVLGDDSFIGKLPGMALKKVSVDLNHFINNLLNYLNISEQELKSLSRNRMLSEYRSVIGYLWKLNQTGSVQEYANWVGRDNSTVLRNISRLEERLIDDDVLRQFVDDLNNTIVQA